MGGKSDASITLVTEPLADSGITKWEVTIALLPLKLRPSPRIVAKSFLVWDLTEVAELEREGGTSFFCFSLCLCFFDSSEVDRGPLSRTAGPERRDGPAAPGAEHSLLGPRSAAAFRPTNGPVRAQLHHRPLNWQSPNARPQHT